MTENEPSFPAPRGRRRLVLPTAAAALALGLVGTGVGYAAVQHGQGTTTAPSTSGSTSRQLLPPGYSYGYGGGPSMQLPTTPYGYGGSSGDTDTTGEASGSQLTGLVRIVSTMKYDGATAAGTGMVLTSDGEVVTNHHVVAGATSIKVKVMSSSTTYTARVVGTDASADVAVLQLEGASGLDTVATDDGAVSQGDPVTAVGDGNGTVDYLSAADGTVIATDQAITTQSEGSAAGERLTGLIEISSDVVGGYSGGATYDADGKVVGMTTAASSGSQDIVGYAIPIAKVLSIADQLESGTASSAYTYGYPAFLGVGLGDGTTVQGAYDGTPAAGAGIGAGDTITRIGGTSTSTATALRAAIAAHEPGDQVSVTWIDSNGSSHTETVTLATGPVE